MDRIVSKVVSEFARRPVSNTIIAIGGILLTKRLSNHLDSREREKFHEDMRRYYQVPLGETVELDMESPEVPHMEYSQESQHD